MADNRVDIEAAIAEVLEKFQRQPLTPELCRVMEKDVRDTIRPFLPPEDTPVPVRCIPSGNGNVAVRTPQWIWDWEGYDYLGPLNDEEDLWRKGDVTVIVSKDGPRTLPSGGLVAL